MTTTQKCLAAYDHALRILQMNQDNYFKRKQILMIVAQSALFVTFAKQLFAAAPTCFKDPLLAKHIVLFVISIFGILSAATWCHFIRRQCNVLDFCKIYMRDIESSLMQLGVPSGYWTYESILSQPESYRQRHVDNPRLIANFRINTTSFHLRTDEGNSFTYQGSKPFPPEGEKFKIGLTTIERNITIVLTILWSVLAVLIVLSWITDSVIFQPPVPTPEGVKEVAIFIRNLLSVVNAP